MVLITCAWKYPRLTCGCMHAFQRKCTHAVQIYLMAMQVRQVGYERYARLERVLPTIERDAASHPSAATPEPEPSEPSGRRRQRRGASSAQPEPGDSIPERAEGSSRDRGRERDRNRPRNRKVVPLSNRYFPSLILSCWACADMHVLAPECPIVIDSHLCCF